MCVCVAGVFLSATGHLCTPSPDCVDDIHCIIYDVYPPSRAFPVPVDHRGVGGGRKKYISGQLWEVNQQSNNLPMNNEST